MDDLQPGDPRSAGPYRLVKRLGSGGMGRVFLGQSQGGRLLAVKVIRPDLAADPQFRARFAQEVAAARTVGGLFTAQVVDADPDATVPWLATTYVPGPSLAEAVVEHGPLPEASVRALTAALAEGLGAIHSAGLVHRDLKPTNILLALDGPRIIDFGISRAAEASALTGTGLVVGSPGFMSPEQATGDEIGQASDIFSMGAVVAFAATGEGPFGTGSVPALLYRVVHGTPAISDVPASILALVEGCLAKDPAERPDTGQILSELGSPGPVQGWLPADAYARYLMPLEAVEDPAAVGHAVTDVSGASPGTNALAGSTTATALPRARVSRPVGSPPVAAIEGATVAPARPARSRPARWLPWAVASLLGSVLLAAAVLVLAKAELTNTPISREGQAFHPKSMGPDTDSSSSSSRSSSSSSGHPSSGSSSTSPVVKNVTPSHGSSSSSSSQVAAVVPQITGESTYQKGQLVYFRVRYSDPGNDATGFGFVGVNGAGWAEENHTFSSPSYGIIGPGSVDYPFNLGCGTSQQHQSDVQVWINDTTGTRSQPLTVHLACSITSAVVPQITGESTYQKGQLVYFRVRYSDPGNDATGFGFVGVNGAGWAEENHTFSNPSYGIIGPGSVDYPFNLGCGTSQEYQSDVQVWINDSAGTRSQPVTIHLACTS